MIAYKMLHFDKEIYQKLEDFQFDRFLNNDGTEKTTFYKGSKKIRQYLQPFGIGQRLIDSINIYMHKFNSN